MNLRIVLTALVAVSMPGLTMADGLSIEPGKWQMTSTVEMSMMGQPQVHSSTECLSESELNPEDFNMDKDSSCDISEMLVNGNTASWSINCAAQGGMQMKGQWEMTSEGDSISGGGSMSADAGGMQFEMTMSWEGHRLGDCD